MHDILRDRLFVRQTKSAGDLTQRFEVRATTTTRRGALPRKASCQNWRRFPSPAGAARIPTCIVLSIINPPLRPAPEQRAVITDVEAHYATKPRISSPSGCTRSEIFGVRCCASIRFLSVSCRLKVCSLLFVLPSHSRRGNFIGNLSRRPRHLQFHPVQPCPAGKLWKGATISGPALKIDRLQEKHI